MRRRALLSSLSLLATGCAERATTSTATASPTPTETATPETLPAVPKPGDDCHVADLPDANYPELPTEATPDAAESFARSFERTYGAATIDGTVDGTDGIRTTVAEETAAGALVWAAVRFDFTQGTEGQTELGSTTTRGWYYVTAEFAVRATGGEEVVPEYGWVTVACR